MKEYEAIHEIMNQCPANHSRDRFFEEIECEDLETWIKNKFKDKELKIDRYEKADGSIVYEIMTAGIHQRYTFTEI